MVQLAGPELDGVFHALADPTRRALLVSLLEGERTVGALAEPHDMSLTAVSKHLRVLEDAGLVSRTRRGRQVVCRLHPGPLAEASEWIDYYRDFWTSRLDRLDIVLNKKRES